MDLLTRYQVSPSWARAALCLLMSCGTTKFMSKSCTPHQRLGESKVVCTLRCCHGVPGKEGGIQVLAGLAPSSQTVGSLFRGEIPIAILMISTSLPLVDLLIFLSGIYPTKA